MRQWKTWGNWRFDAAETIMCRLEGGDCDRRWAVCFLPSPNPRFLYVGKAPFQHCFALISRGPSSWQLFEWGFDGMCLDFYDDYQVRTIIYQLIRRGVMICPQQQTKERRAPPVLATCATLVSDLVAVRGWIWTPTALYRRAIEQGAVTLWDSRYVEDDSEAVGGKDDHA